MEKPRVGVGIFLFNDKAQLLLGKRIGSHGENTWSIPGGHLEYLETPQECAKREALEECGLVVDKVKTFAFSNDIFEKNGKKLHYISLYCIGQIVSGELEVKEPKKCLGWQWFEWEHLPNPLFHPYHEVINRKQIMKYLRD